MRASSSDSKPNPHELPPWPVWLQLPDVGQDPVNHTIGHRLFGAHPVVPIGVTLDLLVGLPGFARDHAVDALSHPDDLPSLDFDVGGRAAHATHWLMQQKTGIRQPEPPIPLP